MKNRNAWTITAIGSILVDSSQLGQLVVAGRKRAKLAAETDTKASISAFIATGTAVAALVATYKEVEEYLNKVLDESKDFSDLEDEPSIFDSVEQWLQDLFRQKQPSSNQAKTAPASPVVGQSQNRWPASNDSLNLSSVPGTIATYILQAAKEIGIDPGLLLAVAKIESGFRDRVVNPLTKATGLFQFLPSTWAYLIKKHKELGFTESDISDPRKNALMGAVYIKTIQSYLKSTLKRNPSPTEIYLGHFLGPRGAMSFLTALSRNPEALGPDLFPKAAQANRALFFNNGVPNTLTQVWSAINRKVVTAHSQFVNPSTLPETSPGLPGMSDTPFAKTSTTLPPVSTVIPPIVVPEDIFVSTSTSDSVGVARSAPSAKTKTLLRNQHKQLVVVDLG